MDTERLRFDVRLDDPTQRPWPRLIPGAGERRLHDPIPPMPGMMVTTTPMLIGCVVGVLCGLAIDKATELVHRALGRRP